MHRFVFASAALALFACNSNPPASRFGHVTITRITTTPDGKTYRLPAGTVVEFNATAGAVNVTDQSLDGNSTTVSVQLPPGTYNATLINPGAGPQWTLDELDGSNAVIGTVQATLDTTLPVQITVTAGANTALDFAFHVSTGGTVTFQEGTVDVTVTVTEQPATTYTFDDTASFGIAGVSGTDSGLLAQLPAASDTGFQFHVSGVVAADSWQEISGEIDPSGRLFLACAGFTPNPAEGGGWASWNSNGNAAFATLFGETFQPGDSLSAIGDKVLCVYDDGTTNYIRVRISHTGAPTSDDTVFTAAAGSGELNWRVQFSGVLPTRVYDSVAHTLDVQGLFGAVNGLTLYAPFSSAVVWPVVSGTFGLQPLYNAHFNGTVNFSLTGN